MLRGVYKKEDFAGVLKDAKDLEKQYGKVEQVAIFSHTGVDGPVFHDQNGKAEQFSVQEVQGLKINWSNTASAYFCGCRSADFAQTFADAQGVVSYGFAQGASFSSSTFSKDYRYVFSKSAPLYLIGEFKDMFNPLPHVMGGKIAPMQRREPRPQPQH